MTDTPKTKKATAKKEMKDIENIFMINTLKHPNTTQHKITKIIKGFRRKSLD
jgi:hypothetical protein